MPLQPFQGPRIKLARAARHTAELKAEVSAYMQRRPAVLALATTADNRSAQCIFLWREFIPLHLSTILGDAVHNLRGALDLLANDVVTACGRVPKKVCFPFAKSALSLDETIKTCMAGANPEAQRMVKALKPYPLGNVALRALHDLDIQDKHLAAITAASEATSPPFTAKEGPQGIYLDWSDARLSPIAEHAPFLGGPPLETGHIVRGVLDDAEFQLTLEKDLPLGGQPVLEVIDQLFALTSGIVDQFEGRFTRRKG